VVTQGITRKKREEGERATDLGGRVIEENLEVFDPEVGNTDVANLASANQHLHLLPCLDEIPVREVLLQVIGVRG
jgi:hypothetical protein